MNFGRKAAVRAGWAAERRKRGLGRSPGSCGREMRRVSKEGTKSNRLKRNGRFHEVRHSERRRLGRQMKEEGDSMGIGFSEMFMIVPFAVVYLALPIATFVLVLLIHRKVARLEKRLGG